jgi:DNA-binding FrmR family transcriptional regulator
MQIRGGVVPGYRMHKQQLQTRLRRIDGHIRGCVREEIRSGGGDAKVDELLQVMDRVLRR